jgi:hypothetical protein
MRECVFKPRVTVLTLTQRTIFISYTLLVSVDRVYIGYTTRTNGMRTESKNESHDVDRCILEDGDP